MSKEQVGLSRRRFLKTAVQAGVCLAVPQIIPGTALGKNGGAAAGERITLGAIGIGNRGRYVLGASFSRRICSVWPSAMCGRTIASGPRRWSMRITAIQTV
jgi:hypothetical protein